MQSPGQAGQEEAGGLPGRATPPREGVVTCPHLLSSDLYRWVAWVQVTIRGETRGCPVLTGLRRGPPGEGEVGSGQAW